MSLGDESEEKEKEEGRNRGEEGKGYCEKGNKPTMYFFSFTFFLCGILKLM